jgi:hypothetical protein
MDRLNLKFILAIVLSIFWTVGGPLLAGTSIASTTLTTTSPPAPAVVECDRALIAVNSGTFIPLKNLPMALREYLVRADETRYEFFLLGGKGRTGNPYLVKNGSGTPLFVYKVYLDKGVGFKTTPEEFKSLDEAALLEMKRVEDLGVDIGFRIPKVYRILHPTILNLQYFPGRELNSIVRDRLVPQNLKDHLIKTYNGNVDKFVANFASRYPTKVTREYTNGDGLKIYQAQVKTPTRTLWIHIKPDGIIVDSDTLQMSTIDPN